MKISTEPAPASRREREKLAHRQEILAAAERVLVRNGPGQSTMEEVAAEADFSVGAIYKYFESKEKLYGQVLENIVLEFTTAFEQDILTQADPLKALIGVVDLRLRHVEKHGKFFRLLMEPRPGSRVMPDSAIPESCRGAYDVYLRKVSGLFEKAMAKGWVRKMDPLGAAIAMEGVLNAFLAFWDRHESAVSMDERRRTVKENFLRHILTDRRKIEL